MSKGAWRWVVCGAVLLAIRPALAQEVEASGDEDTEATDFEDDAEAELDETEEDDDEEDEEGGDEEESAFGGGVEADFRTRYMWHGLPLTTTPVLQPTAWLDAWMCSLWTFANIPLPSPTVDLDLDEVDIGVDCGFAAGNLEVTPGFATYLYPDGTDPTVEFTLELVYSIDWFRLLSRNAIDFVATAGAFATETGVGFAVDWETWGLEGALLAAFSNGTFNEANIGEDKAALTATMLELVAWIDLVSGVYLGPHLGLSVLVPDFAEAAFGERAIFDFGFAVGIAL